MILVVYDVDSDALRTKLARVLEAHGTHVQYSVFECYLFTSEYKELKRQLATVYERACAGTKPTTFSVRCYQLCGVRTASKFSAKGR